MEESNDPFFYTKREEFTSEVFKIEIEGLPPYFGYTELKRLLNDTLQLKSHKIKTGGGRKSSWTFVTFKCEEDREKALSVLEGYKWRGRTLAVKKANPAADPLIRKRKLEEDGDGSSSATKAGVAVSDDIPFRTRVKDVVMPLWQLTYDEQIEAKRSEIQAALVRTAEQLTRASPNLPWLKKNREAHGGMCCELASKLRPSPVLDGYRNKCEFTVGPDPVDRRLNVGFRLAKYVDGSMSVADPSECSIVPPGMLAVAKAFEEYFRASGRDAFDAETHAGYWRQLTVRSNRDNDHLVIVYMHPQLLDQESIDKVKSELRTHFFEGVGKICGVKALFFVAFATRDGGDDHLPEHVGGDHFLHETVSEQRFRVSPNAFFQVNSAAAAVLYEVIGEVAEVNENTVLLDVCCGTGPIAISLAKKVKKVVGIEMVESAVEDAKHNAQLNGLTNVDFRLGKVEDILAGVLYLVSDSKDVVAVVDPPRPGLHNKVIKSLRAAKHLNRLVYVSCNPRAAVTNFVDLCRRESKQFRRNPFVPVRATAVDLFPHTKHCELVILFERDREDP